jgi:hypothetical protein
VSGDGGTVHEGGSNKGCEEGTGGCCSVASCFDVFDSIGVFDTSEGCSVVLFFFFFFFFFLFFFLLFLFGETVDSNDESLASSFDTSNVAADIAADNDGKM